MPDSAGQFEDQRNDETTEVPAVAADVDPV